MKRLAEPLHRIKSQHGIAMLATTLVILIAMTIMTSIVARITVNSQRISANAAHADSAFQVADAGVDNALAYINHNRAYVASSGTDGWLNASSTYHWAPCVVSDVTPPCGDGSVNMYGPDWLAYGPVPHLQSVDSDYSNPVYLLTNNLNSAAGNDYWLGCLNLSRTALVPGQLGALITILNASLNLLYPGLGLPADICLPVNFNGANVPLAPSSANPTIRVVASSNNNVDARGGTSGVQQDLQTASLFATDPMAPLMVHGVPHLDDDIRIWGNPRPPTTPPYDWSILNLNDILGLNITNMLGAHVASDVANLAPILNLTVAEVLALDWNVTFPLSIWSDETTQLHRFTPPHGVGVVNATPRTCLPQFDNVTNSTCLLLSATVLNLEIKMPDVQDEHNMLSMISGLLDTSAPIDFPNDLFEHIFGVPETDSDEIEADAIALADCSSLPGRPGGLYWVNADCDITGIVGTSADPLVLIVRGDITISGGSEFWGVLYQMGPRNNNHRNFEGDASGLRPTFFGSVLAGSTSHYSKSFNIVYDRDVIRRAGYRAGNFVRLPGGWTDEIAAP